MYIIKCCKKLKKLLKIIIIDKQSLRKHFSDQFSNSVKIDPYLYAFGNMYYSFNDVLLTLNSYGIIFTDEIQSVSARIGIAIS